MTYVIDQGTGLVKEGHVAVGPSPWDMIQEAFRGRKSSSRWCLQKNSEALSHKSINMLSQKR